MDSIEKSLIDIEKSMVKMFNKKDINGIYDAFEKKGINKIWVTPKIPFMIPLFFGFTLSFFIGDILFIIMSLIF